VELELHGKENIYIDLQPRAAANRRFPLFLSHRQGPLGARWSLHPKELANTADHRIVVSSDKPLVHASSSMSTDRHSRSPFGDHRHPHTHMSFARVSTHQRSHKPCRESKPPLHTHRATYCCRSLHKSKTQEHTHMPTTLQTQDAHLERIGALRLRVLHLQSLSKLKLEIHYDRAFEKKELNNGTNYKCVFPHHGYLRESMFETEGLGQKLTLPR